MNNKKIIIAGCRDFTDYAFFKEQLSYCVFPEHFEIVHGVASGVDTMADYWATSRNIPVKKFPANWKKYGNSAGPIRNREMAQYGDQLIAFWDNMSPGTANMIAEIKKLDKPYTIIYIRKPL